MNSTASAALSSAENTAASASPPITSGTVVKTVSAMSASRRPGMQLARDEAEHHRNERERHQRDAVQAHAPLERAFVAGRERLLQQPGREEERGPEKKQARPAGGRIAPAPEGRRRAD